MRIHVFAYIVTALVFLGIDSVWLTLMGRGWYRQRLGHILLEQFNFMPALAFYGIYIGGIVLFAISPALSGDRWTIAVTHGALLGLVAYGTYDLTNQATIRGWPMSITLLDLGWGSLLTAAAATIGYGFTTAFAGRL
jgi:uncharacterized membrane protein